MRKTLFAAAAAVSLVFLTGAASAREIVGTTNAYFSKAAVTALATDGSKYTAKVTVTSSQRLATGKTVYTGTYNLNVPNGKQVMLIFSKLSSGGLLTPKTVAHFPVSHSNTTRTFHFHVANAPAGAPDVISLGMVKVGAKLTTPETNPQTEVDEDGNGSSDFDDDQGDNDDMSDDQGCDEDGDGIPDEVDDDDSQGDGDGQ